MAQLVRVIMLPQMWMVAHRGTPKSAMKGRMPLFFTARKVTGMVAALLMVLAAVM